MADGSGFGNGSSNDGVILRECGKNPVGDRRTEDGSRLFRPLQERAFNALKGAMFSVLAAPTGMGKSAVQKAIAHLLRMAGRKVIIAVPQSAIGRNFYTDADDVSYVLPDGTKMHWVVDDELYLIDQGSSESTVNKVIDFALNGAPGSILVCTHQALVLAQSKLGEDEPEMWNGVDLLIDEGHHSRSDTEIEEEQVSAEANKLGGLIQHYLEKQCGRIMLSTATFLRGDALDIIPKDLRGEFVWHEVTVDEYLDSLSYLKNIRVKMMFVESFGSAIRKLKDDRKRTIMYMPRPGPKEENQRRLRSYLAMLGKSRKEGMFMRYHDGTLVCDLATERDRQARRAYLHANEKATPVDWIVCQNVGSEGFDYPSLERAVVLGNRKSIPLMIQRLGRLLRDYPGKSEVEFIIVEEKADDSPQETFEKATDVILTTMALGSMASEMRDLHPVFRTQRAVARIAKKVVGSIGPGKKKTEDEVRKAVDSLLEDVKNDGIDVSGITDGDKEKATKAFTKSADKSLKSVIKALSDQLPREKQAELLWDDSLDGVRCAFEIAVDADYFRRLRTHITDRTMAQLESWILNFFKANGRRPVQTDEGASAWAQWARTKGTSLREVCDRLGMPKLKDIGRTIAGLEAYARAFYKANGRRPTEKDEGGASWVSWARTKGTSLREVCDRLGMPKIVDLDRDMDGCEAYARAFFKAHGRRPTQKDEGGRAWYQWARCQGTSLREVCDRLGMPKLQADAVHDRTMAKLEAYSLDFFKAHGRRPTQKDQGGKAWDQWARCQGTSLSQVCDRLGMPQLAGDTRKPSQPPPPPKSGTHLRKGVKKKKVEE